jgi:starch phosphorylase
MVRDYVLDFYQPCGQRGARLAADSYKRARRLSEWKAVAQAQWPDVSVTRIDSEGLESSIVGGEVTVTVAVQLGPLSPFDVAVQLLHGSVDRDGELNEPQTETLAHAGEEGDEQLFRGTFVCETPGLYGIAVRVVAHHEDLSHPYETGLVAWA